MSLPAKSAILAVTKVSEEVISRSQLLRNYVPFIS